MYNNSLLKRLVDLSVSMCVGLIFSPIVILIAVAIKLDSEGPIIYRAKRVGKGGRVFEMWKFRSMVADADKFLLAHPEYMKEFKTKEGWKFAGAGKDPRITRVGRFIRRFTLDELPQIWNVIKGEMSLVGPRAYRNDQVGNEIEEQLKLYPQLRAKMKVALSIKPGITGPWQTSGRNELSWDKRVDLDAEYAAKNSLLNDVKIIFQTPFAMSNSW